MAICKSCGAYITWGTTKTGKSTPLNIDGKSHWGTCPHASSHRNRKPIKKEKLPDFASVAFECGKN